LRGGSKLGVQCCVRCITPPGYTLRTVKLVTLRVCWFVSSLLALLQKGKAFAVALRTMATTSPTRASGTRVGSYETPTAMVAGSELGKAQYSPVPGGGVASVNFTGSKLQLRGGSFEKFLEWDIDITNVISAAGLTDLKENAEPPTREAVAAKWPNASDEHVERFFEQPRRRSSATRREGGQEKGTKCGQRAQWQGEREVPTHYGTLS